MSEPSKEPTIVWVSKLAVVMIATYGAGYIANAATDSTGLSVAAAVLTLGVTGYLLERKS